MIILKYLQIACQSDYLDVGLINEYFFCEFIYRKHLKLIFYFLKANVNFFSWLLH